MRLASALALTLASAALAFAASPKTKTASQHAPDPSIATFHVTTRETIVDVTVVDDHGNPVHGLKREDFTIKEDGKEQPIRSFNEFGKQAVTDSPKLPPNTYTNLQPPAAGPVNIILLDGLNTAPEDSDNIYLLRASLAYQARMKSSVKDYLGKLPPGTRVAVLSLSKNLRILQGPTSDRDLLRASVDTMQLYMDGHAISFYGWCDQRDSWNSATIETLQQVAAYVAGIKGKKNLIWFTVPNATLTDPAQQPRVRPVCLPDYTVRLQHAYDLLMEKQVAIYPIDVRGVTGDLVSDLALESFAEATGGAAFYNNNDLGALAGKAIDAGSSYYTLSYVPPSTEYDGRHHTISIKATQPGLHLVYRPGYDAQDPSAIAVTAGLSSAATPTPDHSTDTQQIMSRGLPTYTDLLFDVQVEPSTAPVKPTDPPILGTLDPKLKEKLKDKRLIRYGFQYAFPASQLTFTDGPEGTHKGALEIDIAAYDTEGKPITSLSQTIQMPLTAERYPAFVAGPFRFFQQLDLPPGPAFLRIGIHDLTSNKIGTLEIPLSVPKTPPDRAATQPTPPTK